MQGRLVGGALALLIVSCIAPCAAEAGCYHRSLTQQEEGPDHFVLLRDAGAMDAGSRTSALPPAPILPGERPGGCSGPFCSDRSDIPETPVSITVPRSSHWAVVDVPPPTASPSMSPAHRDDRDARPAPMAESIFHPPRRNSHS